MRFRYLAGVSLAMIVAAPATGWAQVQTFEDYTPCDNTGGNVGLYGSVNYANLWTCYSYPQPPYNAHSGTNRVYTFDAAAPFYFTGSPVTFDGAWFSGYSYATVQFELWLGGSLVGTSGILAPTDVPTFLSSGYSGSVDQVRVLSPEPDFYIMDDVTFNGGGLGPVVPEPSTIALLGTGLIGVFGVVRRRSRFV